MYGHRISVLVCFSVTALGFLCPSPAGGKSPATEGWKLLIDDHWIESKSGVERVLHQPEKHPDNPLIKGDAPWASNPYCYGTVLYDEASSQFRLWYMSYNAGLPLHERTPILYAVSKDGIAWERPALGLAEFRGSKQNNILMWHYGHHDLYSPSVVKDDQDPDPRRRYKMIWWDFPNGRKGYRDDGMCVAFSPDGIHWNKHPGNPVLSAKKQERSISDVMAVMYDRAAKKFVTYSKGWADPWPAFRQIVRTESENFIDWSEPEVVITHAHNENDPQSYGMSVTQYDDVYLGLMCSYKKPGDETIDIQLVVSRDNQAWERVAGQQTFLPLGEDGSWDDGMIFCAPLIEYENRVLIYYGGWDGPHNTSRRRSGIGLASLRKQGFVSLDAGESPGVVTTEPFTPTNQPLVVNADAEGGTVRVELLGDDGKPLPGYSAAECEPLTGDGVEQRIRWRNHDTPPADATVRLRFQLRNASLYAFRWAETER